MAFTTSWGSCYILNRNLETEKSFPLSTILKQDKSILSSFGYRSNHLVCGDDYGTITFLEINTSGPKVVFVHNIDTMVTAVSLSKRFIMAGSETGDVALWNHRGEQLLDFRSDRYCDAVSIGTDTLIATLTGQVYVWKLNSLKAEPKVHQLPSSLVSSNWVCLNPFGAVSVDSGEYGSLVHGPFLCGNVTRIGEETNDEETVVQFRPLIQKSYWRGGRGYFLSSHYHWKSNKWYIKVRDLKSQQILDEISISGEPKMLWCDQRYVFLVDDGTNEIRRFELNLRLWSRRSGKYLESVCYNGESAP